MVLRNFLSSHRSSIQGCVFYVQKDFGWIIALIYLQLVSASAIKPIKTVLILLLDKHQRRINELPGGKLMTDHVWTLSAASINHIERNLNFKCLFYCHTSTQTSWFVFLTRKATPSYELNKD